MKVSASASAIGLACVERKGPRGVDRAELSALVELGEPITAPGHVRAKARLPVFVEERAAGNGAIGDVSPASAHDDAPQDRLTEQLQEGGAHAMRRRAQIVHQLPQQLGLGFQHCSDVDLLEAIERATPEDGRSSLRNKEENGGRDRDRTCDPYDVNVVLSR